jgi:uncharacterized membrane protein YgcG
LSPLVRANRPSAAAPAPAHERESERGRETNGSTERRKKKCAAVGWLWVLRHVAFVRPSVRFLSAFRRRLFISSCFELRDEGPPAVGAPEAAAGQSSSSSSSFVSEREQEQSSSSSSGGRTGGGGDDETGRRRTTTPEPEQQQPQRPPARAAVVFVEGEGWMPPRGGPAPRSPRL